MILIEKIRELQAGSKFKLSKSTVRRRLVNNWDDTKIMNTRPQMKPKRCHPLKDASYKSMADKKGWAV
mgnify:FL=1|tara:strand:- start:1753 stop:1956 length:204 start_codon:yes stop_codon:yes gene_type:complete